MPREHTRMSLYFVEVEPVEAHAILHCASLVCRNVLRVSLEDAAEETVPRVEGWRTRKEGGEIFAYCASCAERYLPSEESILYERVS